MHQWFNLSRHDTTAIFAPGLGDTHLGMFASFREMVPRMRQETNTEQAQDDFMWDVACDSRKYRLSVRENKKGTTNNSDYTALQSDKAARLLRRLVKKSVRVIQIMRKECWMEMIFVQDKKKYCVEIIVLA